MSFWEDFRELYRRHGLGFDGRFAPDSAVPFGDSRELRTLNPGQRHGSRSSPCLAVTGSHLGCDRSAHRLELLRIPQLLRASAKGAGW